MSPRRRAGQPPQSSDEDFTGLLLRIGTGKLDAHGAPAGDPDYGAQLQQFAIAKVPAEARARVHYETKKGKYPDGQSYQLLVPKYVLDEPAYGPLPHDLRISPRVAPIMVGLGLLEAIPEKDLLSRVDTNDEDGDGISGRANMVYDEQSGDEVLGRFGWKAEQPNIRQQVAGAFVEDIGITNPMHGQQSCTLVEVECNDAANGGEPEVEEDIFGKVVTYSRLLAVPVRERWKDDQTLAGRRLFYEVGCESCHTARQRTASAVLPELENQHIFPYTDLLLHDMGDDLGDDRPAFDAEGNEWRTPPLWGVGRIMDVNHHDRLLHDGRARGVEEAILWHGGEAEATRQRFEQLEKSDRAALIRFVESL